MPLKLAIMLQLFGTMILDYQWHLAIVENIVSSETVQLSYLKRMDSAGRDWVFPEEAEIQQTSMEQILDVPTSC